MEPKRVALIGSGNWGSVIAKIIGHNVTRYPHFEKQIKMYVFEEIIDGKKLTEIINTTHENVKYLPGHKIPENVVAVPNVLEVSKDADILIFVLPHKFVPGTCKPLQGKLKPNAIALSLIKGFGEAQNGEIVLISDVIMSLLKLECYVLMGANLAPEVADDKFCETTIGCNNPVVGKMLKELTETPNFRVTVVSDRHTVEICGALKNVVACAAGYCDGLHYGDNTKAAIIRLGLKEIVRFCKTFFPTGLNTTTFFESCGVADLVTTCYGGRNRRLSEAFTKTEKSYEQLEQEMLNGMKLQGPQTADEVCEMIAKHKLEHRFPLFIAVDKIAKRKIKPEALIEYLRNEPDDM